MTYTFKLSARLARLRSRMFLLLLPLAGCVPESGSPNDPTPNDSTVIAINIDPDVIVVTPDQPVSFAASGEMVAGGSVIVPVTWSASGGTMSESGVFTAHTAGQYYIIAWYGAENLTDSARVYVNPPPPPTLASIVVTPAAATLDTGEARTFAAYGVTTGGDSIAVPVSWTVPGYTMSQSGVFQSPVAGNFLVIAWANGGMTDTAHVTVSTSSPPPPPPGLAGVVVTPSNATVQTGQNVAFAAYGLNTAGDSIAVTVSWASNGGTISSNGVFQAQAAGTYAIVAQSGGKADTANATVTAPPPPPSGLANECNAPQPGWVFCDDFDQDRLSSYFEYSAQSGSFVRANGLGNSGSYAMKARFVQGQVNAGSLHLAFGKTPQAYFQPADAGTANYREIYWRFYVKYQAGWTGGGGAKLTRAFGFASPSSWAQNMFGHVWSGGTNHNYLVLDPASGTDLAGNLVTTTYNDFPNMRWLGATSNATPIFDAAHVGSWYCIETHIKLNSSGQSNGVFELWIDGNAEASRTGLNWVGNFSAYGINAVYLENYWNSGSPATQERYFDNLVVSTQRIGC
jgi:hypothetical protein